MKTTNSKPQNHVDKIKYTPITEFDLMSPEILFVLCTVVL